MGEKKALEDKKWCILCLQQQQQQRFVWSKQHKSVTAPSTPLHRKVISGELSVGTPTYSALSTKHGDQLLRFDSPQMWRSKASHLWLSYLNLPLDGHIAVSPPKKPQILLIHITSCAETITFMSCLYPYDRGCWVFHYCYPSFYSK